MAKRKCEQPPMVLPPCKKPQCELPVHPRHCMPHTVPECPKGKRKLETRSAPSPERDSLTHRHGTAAASQPPSKRPRPSEGKDFQCQKDEAFQEYNSFHFWRTPLPEVDFSELVVGACDGDRQTVSPGTDALEEMDN